MSIFTNSASRSVQEAKEYTAAVLGLLGSTDPDEVLTETTMTLRQSIHGLSPHQLAEPEAPGKWAIRDVLQHLADSELVWGYRLRMVLAHDRPAITGYDQDLWAKRLRYQDADVDEAIQDFAQLRQSNLRLLRRIPAADLKRVGVHSERGEESVEHMIKLYAGHDLLHIRQVQRIREAVEKS